MARIYLQSFYLPPIEGAAQINHNLYIDSDTNEFVGVEEASGTEIFRTGGSTGSTVGFTGIIETATGTSYNVVNGLIKSAVGNVNNVQGKIL